MWPQIIINSLVLSAEYALFTSGLSLIFSVMRVVNFAHGAIFTLGAYVALFLYGEFHINYIVMLFAALIIISIVGFIMEKICFRPLAQAPLSTVIATFGILVIIENAISVGYSPDPKPMQSPVSGAFSLFNATVSKERLLVVIIGILSILALTFLIKYTKLGRAMRAVIDDPEEAALLGIGVRNIRYIGAAMGCALAGLGGALMITLLDATPSMGFPVMIKGFIIVILGGLGSIPGAILGSVLLGFIDSIGQTLIGYSATIIAFIIMILFLLVRPRGLFGQEE